VFHYCRRLNYAKRKMHRPRFVLGKGTHFLTARRHEARRKRFFSSSPPLCCRFHSCAEAFCRGRNPTKRGAFAHLPREICPKRGTFETKKPHDRKYRPWGFSLIASFRATAGDSTSVCSGGSLRPRASERHSRLFLRFGGRGINDAADRSSQTACARNLRSR